MGALQKRADPTHLPISTEFERHEALSLWTIVLESSHKRAYHWLAIFTPRRALDESLSLAIFFRDPWAAVCLLGALCNRHGQSPDTVAERLVDDVDLLDVADREGARPPVALEVFQDEAFRLLRRSVGPFGSFLGQDLDVARSLRPTGGPLGTLARQLQREARSRWSIAVAVVVLRSMWKSWVRHVCRPESGYVRRSLAGRFRELSVVRPLSNK